MGTRVAQATGASGRQSSVIRSSLRGAQPLQVLQSLSRALLGGLTRALGLGQPLLEARDLFARRDSPAAAP